MNPRRLWQEVSRSTYYRRNPFRVAQLIHAKWRLKQCRVHDPISLLVRLGINPQEALRGFEQWRPSLEQAVARVHGRPDQQGGISFEDGLLLYGIVRALKPEFVVETGVAAGVSTAFIGAALIANSFGTLYSIELPSVDVAGSQQPDGNHFDWPAHGVGWAVPPEVLASLGSRHTLVLEDVRTALPRLLAEIPTIDLFFHDDLHSPDHMLWEYRLVWPHLRLGGMLASDDVNEGWLKFCRLRNLPKSALSNVNRFAAVTKTP